MITNHLKALFFLIFISSQCYAFDAFVIDEKTSLFSANHMTSPVIQANYVGWKAGWEWAGTNITPEYIHQQAPYSGSTFSGRNDKLDINFTGEVVVSEKQIDWIYQWNKQTDAPDAIGFGIDFKLERYSLGFLQESQNPELLADNKGWRWQTPNGQTIEVTFTPALASLSFESGQKNSIRALFFTNIDQGTQQTTMTIKASQNVSISGPVVLDYDNSDPAQWHKDLLPKTTSPIDLSFLNDNEKPAGKHGFILANKDNLFFEDNTPVKFWGTNVIAYSLFSSSDSNIEIHAKRIAKFGFNLVRIHHHDSLWVNPNIFNNPSDNTLELSDESLRKIDLWIKHLKAEGVYIWLDLHVGRSVTNNDGIDAFDDFAKGKDQVEIKGFNYYNESIQTAMQEFNESYLNHVNSYTGIAYKDDPAVISMLITNENDLTQHFGNSLLANKNVPIHNALFSEDVKQFSETYGLNKDEVGKAWLMGEPKIYLNDAEHRFNQKMIGHLEQLGVKSLIATTNSWGSMGLFGLPSLTDGSIVDVHSYGRSEEFKFNPRANPGFLTWAGAAQVTGKPLSFTEWNIERFPATRDRFTAPIFTASIAKLQGWDAIMQYGYSQDANWSTRASNYSSHNDPGMMALMPAASLLFRQDHVAEANNLYELKLNKEDFFFTRQDPRSSKSIRTLLETSRFTIGMPETSELPWLDHNVDNQNAIVITDANQDFIPAGQDYVESDTLELKRDWTKGIHTINTEKSQIASGWIGGKTIALDDVSFNITTKKAVVAVQSLENKPIIESNTILITIVARSQPSNGFNTVPFLSEPVTGQISIEAPEGLKLYPVNSDGHLGQQILITRDNEGKYVIDIASEMKTHWFKLQNSSIPFRITSPTNDTVFSHSEPVTIKTNGSDLNDISQVQFFNGDGDLLETIDSAPYEYTTNNLPSGNNIIIAQATYEDGTTESETVSFSIGEVPFGITSPLDGTIFAVGESVNIKTNASTTNGEIKAVYFWRDNWQWLGSSETEPYELTVNNLSPGEHILRSRLVFQDDSVKNALNITIIVGEEITLPLVSNIQVATTDTSATITWDTVGQTDSTINYGLDNNYGEQESDTSMLTSHSITLTGLTENTEYHYQILSTDVNGNSNVPVDQVFTTSPTTPDPDPVVSNIQVSVTDTSATISWDTTELADSSVNYGLDNNYGSNEIDTSMVTSHSITLIGLTANTEYHYQVLSTDANGISNIPVDQVFTTEEFIDISAPVISDILVIVTDTTAIITWITNEAADSAISYGLNDTYDSITDSADHVTSHSIELTNLVPTTSYHFEVSSADSSTNIASSSDQVFITKSVVDITPPVIDNIQATVTDTTAIITWTTDEISDSSINYGLDSSYGLNINDTNLNTSHSLVLNDLTADTDYRYEITSTDSSANIGISTNLAFTTASSSDTGMDNCGTGIKFDGINDWVNIPDLTLANDFTIEGWFKLAPGIDYRDVLFGQEGSGPDIHFTAGKVRLYAYGIRVTANTAILADTWEHIAITRSGANLTVYINGAEDAKGRWNGSLSIKAIGRGNRGYFKGMMDEIRIWNLARTEAQINNSYETDVEPNAPGLISYWNFNDTEQIITDTSSSENHASLGASTEVGSDDPIRLDSIAPITENCAVGNNNTAPVANNDLVGPIEAGESISFSVTENDVDSDDNLNLASIEIISVPIDGTATVDASGTITYTNTGTTATTDRFSYTVTDTEGALSNEAIVSITVIEPTIINTAPIANNDSIGSLEAGETTSFTVTGNDIDSDGNLNPVSVVIVLSPANGTATVDTSGTITYTNTNTTATTDTLSYTVSDTEGVISNEATVSITITEPTPINTAPIANNDMVDSLEAGGIISFTVTENDVDSDGNLNPVSVVIVSSPIYGTATVDETGTITYLNDGGSAISDTLSYTVADTQGAISNEAIVSITINASPLTNEPPVTQTDMATVQLGESIAINVLANDSDSDGTLNKNSLVIVSNPSVGTVDINSVTGEITYSHNGSATSNDSFTYTVEDDKGDVSNEATVLITITSSSASCGKGIELDGINDWVNIPDLTLTNDFTVEGWFKLAPGIDYRDVLFGQEGSGPDIHFTAGRVRLYAYGIRVTANTAILADTWEHIAITRSGTTLSVYINGIKDAKGRWNGSLSIKAIGRGNRGYYKGMMDEIRIWDVARTEAEIRTNFETDVEPNALGLIGYWNFNDTAQIISDVSSSENHASLGASTEIGTDDPVRLDSLAPLTENCDGDN